jgi:hypothetical protein
MNKEKLIQDILRSEKVGTTKQALRPSEGIYYVIPRKTGSPIVVSRRAEDFGSDSEDKLLHMFMWQDVLRSLAHEFKLTKSEVEDLKDNYMCIPRGRVQKQYDVNKGEYTGSYVIFHGGDIPVNLISNFVYQDFGLGPLASAKKVVWQVEDHEKMDANDRKILNKIIDDKKKKKQKLTK